MASQECCVKFMDTRIIPDIGSTHNGNFKNCVSAIINASASGVKDIKFQLLEKRHVKNGNIPIDKKWLPDLVKIGKENNINVFASVWSLDSMKTLRDAGADTVKFAYSMINELSLQRKAMIMFEEVIISGDIMNVPIIPCLKLFCVPMYPVYFKISFEELFPKFDGFSDHTMGISQTIDAIKYGAKIIEKHVCQDKPSNCPDARFAVSWDKIKYLAERF